MQHKYDKESNAASIPAPGGVTSSQRNPTGNIRISQPRVDIERSSTMIDVNLQDSKGNSTQAAEISIDMAEEKNRR